MLLSQGSRFKVFKVLGFWILGFCGNRVVGLGVQGLGLSDKSSGFFTKI